MLSANQTRSLLPDRDDDGDINDNDTNDEKSRMIRIRVEAKEKEDRTIIEEGNKNWKCKTKRRRKSFSTPVVLTTWT